MKRWFAIALFGAALLALFVAGQWEKRRANQALESAITSLNTQLKHEDAGTSTPASRAAFLKRQKQLLGAMRGTAVPPLASPAPKPAAPTPSAPAPTPTPAPAPSAPAAAYMPLVITAVFGLAALWIILSNGYKVDPEARKWAFGTLGLIVGYWLKG
jgi:hypothetical protein